MRREPELPALAQPAGPMARRAAAAGALLALLLAACGGGGYGGDSSYSASGAGGMGGYAAPQITTQPESASAAAGQTAPFSVVATGGGTLSYQWMKNNVDISGATQATYTTPALAASDNNAQYAVVVSNSDGSITSNQVILTVT